MKEWLKPFIILANDKKIKLDFQKEGNESFLAKIDKVKFPWIISNLLANAIRLSPKEGEIKITLKKTSQDIIVEMAKDAVNGVNRFCVARWVWRLFHRAGKPRSIDAIHRHPRGASSDAHISAGVSKASRTIWCRLR